MQSFHQSAALPAHAVAPRCRGIEYVELCTSNLVQASYFYRTVFGLQPVAKTQVDMRGTVASVPLRSGNANLLLTSPVRPGPLSDHLFAHGEGVTDIALSVSSVDEGVEYATAAGATLVKGPETIDSGAASVKKAVLRTCGTLQHTLVEVNERHAKPSADLPLAYDAAGAPDRGLVSIDHVALAVEPGTLNQYCDLYCRAFGLKVTHTEKVVTKRSAMNSKVIQNDTGSVTFSVVEPLPASGRSQIAEFLEFNRGPGAQHVAFLCRNIIETVRGLQSAGVEFLSAPRAYYADTPRRVGRIEEDLKSLEELGILVDRDESGYLLQIFSKPVQTVPTMFVEIIQRRGATGFGTGNIWALFEAIEREQALRESL